MVMVSDGCKGKHCEYYRARYKTQVYHDGYMPEFEVPIDEYCAHPDTYKPTNRIRPIDYTGVQLQIIKKCPNDK